VSQGAKRPPRGMLTVQQLKARCIVDPATHCWLWQGACSVVDGTPRLYTFDHARGEKRTISGPLGAWNIAHQAAPLPGYYVFRACGHRLCLNPAHLREMRDQAQIGRHIAASGRRKGIRSEACRAAAAKGRAARGIVDTPPEVVRAIRAAPADVTGRALAKLHGLNPSTVSSIRRGLSHRDMA
jgi:hypothetical protein